MQKRILNIDKDSNASYACDDKETRTFGLFSGTDKLCQLNTDGSELTTYPGWPIMCLKGTHFN